MGGLTDEYKTHDKKMEPKKYQDRIPDVYDQRPDLKEMSFKQTEQDVLRTRMNEYDKKRGGKWY